MTSPTPTAMNAASPSECANCPDCKLPGPIDFCVYDDCPMRVAAPVAERAAAPASVPEGFVLVPLRMTREMQRVTDEEGWQWEDLLAAAESITEEQYNEISAAPEVAQPAAQGDRAASKSLIDLILAYGAACTCMDERATEIMECIKRSLATPAPAAGEPSADELMFVGHEFLKWNRSQPTPPVAACKELYIARKVLEIRAAHIKATHGGKGQDNG